jgi:hypothetical protein
MTNPFTALDFETATGYRNSSCQSKKLIYLFNYPINSIGADLRTSKELQQKTL